MNTQMSHAEAQSHPVSTHGVSSERKTMWILCMCMALQMTGFVMILPLFARRFSELGAGVGQLSTSIMAGALASTLAAPFMGALADRFGRRLLVLGSLAIYVLAFVGYLFAPSALAFILLRALVGIFTAGLIPAVMGIVADLAPIERRAYWIGIVSGGASFGWIAGPILGGVCYDRWGYSAAVLVSILMALVTFLTALFTLPETRLTVRQALAHPTKEAVRTERTVQPGNLKSIWGMMRTALPRSLPAFLAVLCISFAVMFAWAFIEPSFMFYAYDDLGWSSSMLGLVMSTYGVAMLLGEFGLSQLSDRFGRKRVIVLGVILFAAQFIGLAIFKNYVWISISFVIAGLGNALFDPALSAYIMDITPQEHQASIQGLKSTAASLGNILGPGLAVVVTSFLGPQSIFLVAVGAVLLTSLVGLSVKIEPPSAKMAQSSIP